MIEDYLYRFISLYYRSPQWLKSSVGRLYASVPLTWRYGKTFTQFRSLLSISEQWSEEELRAHQTTRLRNLLEHCDRNVPYYQAAFERCGFRPDDFQSLSDLARLPFLTKDIILQERDALIARNIPRSRLLYYSTGGTTGTPMSFFNEKGVARPRELAFITTMWKRVGYEIGDPIVTLRGNVVPSSRRNTFWEHEPIKNRLVLSTYHMTDENLRLYDQKIREFCPKYIHTYPSALTILAKYLHDHGLPPYPSVKAALCSSEAFYAGQREFLEKVLQCRIFSWYGLGEMVALAGECECSSNYHVFPQYGILEIVDEDGTIVEKEGRMGEIVGTGFDRDIMPFLRYRTGDFAEYLDQKCPCGRQYRLLKRVEGRWLQEQVVTHNGNFVSITALNMHSPIFEHVRRFQFFQEQPGKVVLRLVPKPTFTAQDLSTIQRAFMAKFDPRMVDLTVTTVDEGQIEIGKSGKFRFLIQKLST